MEEKKLADIGFKDFVPYKPEDISVIIPHRNDYPNRWKWFWPQYKASVPEEVLRNTVVVIHCRTDAAFEIDDCCVFISYKEKIHSMIKPTLEGMKHAKTRLLARITDDSELSKEWVPKALEIFNQEPHLKILSEVTFGDPHPDQLKGLKMFSIPWVKSYLHDGEYRGIEFIFPTLCIANRAIWMSYYAEVIEQTLHGLEDVIFTILSRADGIPVINFGGYVKSRGKTNQDVIR